MKAALFYGLGLLVLSFGATPAQAQARQACNVTVDITDTDPKGTHVRAGPGAAIIATLASPEEGWVAVHVTGLTGDWFEIDRAVLMGSDPPAGGKIVFRGKGYLHRSMLGLSGMQNGGAIYADHDIRSRSIDAHAVGDQTVDLLGCWEGFVKVRVKKGVGWTKDACTNLQTTCA